MHLCFYMHLHLVHLTSHDMCSVVNPDSHNTDTGHTRAHLATHALSSATQRLRPARLIGLAGIWCQSLQPVVL